MHEIEFTDKPDPKDVQQLGTNLSRFNMDATGFHDGKEFAAILKDGNDDIIAGISGWTWGGMCEVELLWVTERARGHGLGSKLLAGAEDLARERGCKWIGLNTFDFQAPDFYLRHGYEVLTQLEGHPPGHTDFFLRKQL